MTTDELTDLLKNIIERLADAKDEIEGEDDDIALAEIAREMVDEAEGIASQVTYGDVMMLTSDDGLVIRTGGGDEFQITIVQTEFGGDED